MLSEKGHLWENYGRIMIPDYHIHSDLSLDGGGSILEYAQKAQVVGLREICLTPHLDLNPEYSNELRLIRVGGSYLPSNNLYWVSVYLEELKEVEMETGLIIKRGLEIDYYPGVEEHLLPFLQAFPWDFVLGSVHCLGHLDLAKREDAQRLLELHSLERIVKLFVNITSEAIQSGFFHGIAHLDSFRRSNLPSFRHDFAAMFSQVAPELLVLLKEKTVALEINTSGFGKYPVYETFPSLELLKKAKACGIELITFGSDCHSVSELASGFPEGIALAHQAGFKETFTFKGGKVESSISF